MSKPGPMAQYIAAMLAARHGGVRERRPSPANVRHQVRAKAPTYWDKWRAEHPDGVADVPERPPRVEPDYPAVPVDRSKKHGPRK